MIPLREGDSMRVAPQFVMTRSSVVSPHRADAGVIDARPRAMRGILMAAALVVPFWTTVAAVALRLAGLH
jgi:hypothetical protein